MRYAVLIAETGKVSRVIPERTTDIETARAFREIVDGSYCGDDVKHVVTAKTEDAAAKAAIRERIRDIKEFCKENDLDISDFAEEIENLKKVAS